MITSQKVTLGKLREFLGNLNNHADHEQVEIKIIEHGNNVTMTFVCGSDNVVFAFSKAS